MRRCGLHVMGCALALLVIGASPLHAQQSLDLPPPVSQSTPAFRRPRISPRPTPPSAKVETIPQVRLAPQNQSATPEAAPPPPLYEPAPQPAPSYVPEPVLPAVFRGCWRGEVHDLDSIQRLPGGPRLGPWTPKTYRLCYRRSGSGPFELTFTEAGIAHDRRITNAEGKMKLLSTDGRTYARMRSLLHFDEYQRPSGFFGNSTFAVDELTDLQCTIQGNVMVVAGNVYGEHGGSPWFKGSWHTVFYSTSDEPPLPE